MPFVKNLSFIFVLVLLAGCAELGRTSDEAAREIVRQAEGTYQRISTHEDLARLNVKALLDGARGVVILPSVVKAGFFGGAEGGDGVMLVRGSDGVWSDPAFYTMAAGSFGLQFGVQGAEMVMVLRSDKAVEAVINNQGKFGADAGVTFGIVGLGVEGSTTTNVGADIVVYANAFLGFYGGITVEGAALVRRNDLNRAYYGQEILPAAILLERNVHNPNADPLKAALAAR